MKFTIALLFSSASAIELSRFRGEYANIQSGSDLMSSAELNHMLNQRAALNLKSYSRTLQEINQKVTALEEQAKDVNVASDPDWGSETVATIEKLRTPLSGMVTSWNDWWMANNELGLNAKWDPENNVTQ